jgi:hypothetical protein
MMDRDYRWSEWKVALSARSARAQFSEGDTEIWAWFHDGPERHLTTLWKQGVPHGVELGGYSQEQNDADLADFEAHFRARANLMVDAPRQRDNRPVVVNSPGPEGWNLFFTGAGDDPSPTAPESGRGTGQKIRLSFAGAMAETKQIEFGFAEPVELHDGQLIFKPVDNWGFDDRWSFSVRMPPTQTAAASPPGSGNCNRVPTGLGYDVILPAAGDGADQVDLATAVPVPSSGDGFWDVDQDTGEVAPAALPGAAGWHLITAEVRSYFMRNMPLGHPMGVIDIDTYKAEWVSERWRFVLSVSKAGLAIGEVGGWVMVYRRQTT